MVSRYPVKIIFLFSFLLAACSPESDPVNNTNNTNSFCSDQDGDTICDADEGKDEQRDTDGDGTPDYLDSDSDGDGISDAVEAGDDDPETPPIDSDSDSDPDYVDLDSDNNGIPDKNEGTSDIDDDGIPNYADLDNDGDSIPDDVEIGGDPQDPRNSDDDQIPDYNDADSDNDTIGDKYEGMQDTDGDGIPNYRDIDSDNDGVHDIYEGGTGGNINTPPVDTDGDSHPDFLDADSDNDGLADGQEDINNNGYVDGNETDRLKADTDDDGVSDLIEVAAGTDPQDASDNPQANGNFVFIVPFEETPEPEEDVLNFSTAFQKLDLLFVEDVSGSMSAEMTSVRDGLVDMLDSVVCAPGEDPAVTNCVPEVETGIITFGDGSNDYVLVKEIDSDNADTQAQLPDDGSGGGEMPITAMRAGINSTCSYDASRVGRACFRQGALRLMLLITDEDLDEDDMYNNFQPAYDDLINGQVRVILDFGEGTSTSQNNIYSALSGAQSGGTYLVPNLDLASINIDACNNLGGNPFFNNRAILQGADSNAGLALTCAVQAVGSYLPQDVYSVITNDPANTDADGNPVNAPQEFIDYIEVHMPSGDAQCPDGYNSSDSSGNGYHDIFLGILPGSPVCWKIHVKENVSIEAELEPQMFMATVMVYGEGGALLDTRDVYFLVPPDIEGPGVIE